MQFLRFFAGCAFIHIIFHAKGEIPKAPYFRRVIQLRKMWSAGFIVNIR